MNLTRHSFPLAAAMALAGPAAPTSEAASLMVDWLSLGGDSSTSSFALINDAGFPVATGALAVESGKGVSFPGFPQNRMLNADYWAAPPDTRDSMTGDGQVSAIDFRVVPQNGQATYTIELSVPAGQELVLAVGGLFRGASGATESVTVAAFSGGENGPMELLGIIGWNNGLTAYDRDLEWDEPAGTFSTTVGSEGDSEIGFVRVAPITGADPRVFLSVPEGFASGTGDTVSVAIGFVIPEPGLAALLSLGVLVLLTGRRR